MTALPVYRAAIVEDWIDYNGHLSEAFYVLLFGYATDQVMDGIGLDADARSRTGSSLYTVEAHVRYLREVALGAEVEITSTIVTAGAKKLHLAHEMRVDGELVATEELMCLHVAGQPAATAPFPHDVAGRIAELSGTRALEWVGRAIG
ncbi:thioesterase family protein [Leucobacter tardus]|uniref:Thioesterase family protein n=1 Tax=Leucobacter tardus TaxID=501483 RepID=A0A939QC69_9MICO|nr:thioesterase family protein [Leucobacter tardus]MBO2988428.1 thioesterase family protein [Leucobacter tardus]